jgi:arginyl-tRNA synthetase
MPEIIEPGAKNWEPHHVANYLIELARAFYSFYGNTKIIDEDDVMAPYRLGLVSAVGQVIKNGLYVLGIEVPERM